MKLTIEVEQDQSTGEWFYGAHVQDHDECGPDGALVAGSDGFETSDQALTHCAARLRASGWVE